MEVMAKGTVFQGCCLSRDKRTSAEESLGEISIMTSLSLRHVQTENQDSQACDVPNLLRVSLYDIVTAKRMLSLIVKKILYFNYMHQRIPTELKIHE
jgi:hypothetical protein